MCKTKISLFFLSLLRNEIFLGLVLLTAIFAFIFPDLFLLRRSPMIASPLTLKDPTVSWSVFMPAFREFRYEFLEHGNVLWSNLRGLGQPLLGNSVQAAPLFPMNLALVWLPDWLYWSVMPMLRTTLIGLGAYLICLRVFKLSFIASLSFALFAGFNIDVLRWMNHPWQNGLLAGIWYTYFCCVMFSGQKKSLIAFYGCWLGLIVSIIGMATNGFPAASALSAMFALIVFLGFLINNWVEIRHSFFKSLILIVIAHVVGLAVSATQIFALLEFMDVSQLEFRIAASTLSFGANQLFSDYSRLDELSEFLFGFIWSVFFYNRSL